MARGRIQSFPARLQNSLRQPDAVRLTALDVRRVPALRHRRHAGLIEQVADESRLRLIVEAGKQAEFAAGFKIRHLVRFFVHCSERGDERARGSYCIA